MIRRMVGLFDIEINYREKSIKIFSKTELINDWHDDMLKKDILYFTS